jgi:hypothetical protein
VKAGYSAHKIKKRFLNLKAKTKFGHEKNSIFGKVEKLRF